LEEMGHEVAADSPELDGLAAMRNMMDAWFFGFDLRLETYSKQSGHTIGADTLEPVVRKIHQHAIEMKRADFLAALAGINTARRQLARSFVKHDVSLCPTTARTAAPWCTSHLVRP